MAKKKGTGRKLHQVSPYLPGASAPPEAEMAKPQPADAPGPLQAEVAAPPQLPGAPALPGAETAAPGSPHAEMATPRLPAALAPPESGVVPLTEVLGEQQQVATLARRWRWVALASWPRRWLPAVLGLLRRVASWVAARDLLGHWARRAAPPSHALVGDALAAAVVASCSSARLRPLMAVLSASLAGVEPAASPSEDVPEESGVTASGSLHGDELAAAATSPTSHRHEDGFLAGVAHAGCASPHSSSAPPPLEVTSEVAVASSTSPLQGPPAMSSVLAVEENPGTFQDPSTLGVREVEELGMDLNVPTEGQPMGAGQDEAGNGMQPQGAGQDQQATGAGQDHLGNGKQPMGLEQAQFGRRLPMIKPSCPFDDGFGLEMLFGEQNVEVDINEDAVSYARYCLARSQKVKRKDSDMCHICHFKYGHQRSIKNIEMKRHCWSEHTTYGFPCEKTGCFIRTETLADAGIHYHYCHEQRTKDWWRNVLE